MEPWRWDEKSTGQPCGWNESSDATKKDKEYDAPLFERCILV